MVDSRVPGARDTVIVGAGIVGCATAYHLAARGHGDVAVVDQGPIPATGGSTVHAPGGVGQGGPNGTLAAFARESRDLYRAVDGFRERGGIDIAADGEELAYMRLLADYAESWGVEARVVGPEEVGRLNPDIDTDRIAGALHVPSGGSLRTFDCLDNLRRAAEEGGITFHERTEVTDVRTADGAVETVVTDRGPIEADRVLVAANIWSPLLGEMVGVDVPLVPFEHQYAITEPIPELDGRADRQWEGGFRYRRGDIYAGPQGQGYGIGNYNHEPLPVDPADIDDHDEAMEHRPVNEFFVGDEDRRSDPMRMPASREFTPDDFRAGWEHAVDLVPALEGAEIEEAFNGMFCFTPDGMPLLGPVHEVDGFWLAAAVWVTHAGGVGKAMAEWLTEGSPEMDVTGCHVERFQPHETSPPYVRARGAAAYRNVHDIGAAHPRAPRAAPRNVRRSPFHGQQAELGAEFAEAAGWERPRHYDHNAGLLDEYDVPDRSGWAGRHWSPIEGAEHRAVRDRVGICDLTGLTHVEISGAGAAAFVQRTVPANLDTAVGDVTYTPLVNARGGIIGDATVVRRAQDRFLVLANGGAAGTRQLAWLRERAEGEDGVTVTDRTHELCGVGVWGPRAREMLAPIVRADLDDDAFPFFTARDTYVGEVPVTAVRASYVGELGWELHALMDYGGRLWDLLWEAGREHGLVPFGDGALDAMRLEAGNRLFGADIDNAHDPYEAGLGFAIDLDTEFVGREALRDARGTVDRTLSCLTLDDPGAVVVAGMPVLDGDERVGHATSAGYGYSVDAGVVYGYLPPDRADPGTSLDVRYAGERYPATVRETPLIDRARERRSG